MSLTVLTGGVFAIAPVPALALGSGQWIPVKITDAPAVDVVHAEHQTQLTIVRGSDNRIYFAESAVGDEEHSLYGWLEVPGGGRTPYQVAVHSDRYAGKTYAAAVGMDGIGIWVQTYSWKTGQWSGTWQNWGGVFSSPPEITAFNNEVTVLGAAKLDGNRLYYRRQTATAPVDPAGSNWHRWESPIATTKKVAARYYEPSTSSNKTYLLVAAQGSDSKIYNTQGVKSAGMLYQASAWFEVPGNGLTQHGLSMAEWSTDDDGTPDVIWLAARGTADGVFYQTYQNNCWKGQEYCPPGGWSAFPVQGNTPYGPSIYTLGTTTGWAGPVVAVTESATFNSGIAYQITRPDIPNPAGAYSHFKLKGVPEYPGWLQVSHSDFGVAGSGTHPEEQAAGWNPSWKDSNGNPIPSPVNGPSAAQGSEPVNQWYRWCQVYTSGPNAGQRVPHWMPGENQSAAFADLAAWLDVAYPQHEGGTWNEYNGAC
ncbi:hypothetical protein [Micromonospora sp. NPDC051141]|uniref:hypothetical protein n=1 Tax=Micromonospora sp. NPDC051141 TaxID=3364284 RepID=UPI0037A15B4E